MSAPLLAFLLSISPVVSQPLLKPQEQPTGQTQLRLLSQFPAHDLKGEAIAQIQCSSVSPTFFTVTSDGTAKVWSEPSQLDRTYAPQPPSMLFNGRFASEPHKGLIVAGYNGRATLWSSSSSPPQIFAPHLSGVTDALVLSGDTNRILTSSDDGSIRFWSLNSTQLQRLELPGVSRHLAYSPRLRLIAASQDIGTITLISSQASILSTLPTGQGRINDVIFSPNQNLMLTGGFDGTIKGWIFSSPSTPPALAFTIPAPAGSGWLEGLAINQDGLIAAVYDDGAIRLWNQQAQLLASAKASHDHLMSLCFAADQSTLHTIDQAGVVSSFQLNQPR